MVFYRLVGKLAVILHFGSIFRFSFPFAQELKNKNNRLNGN